jgi:hypothetical protein
MKNTIVKIDGCFPALNVLLFNPALVAWLQRHDPQALVQALRAVGRDTTEAQRYCAGGDLCAWDACPACESGGKFETHSDNCRNR